MSVDSNQRTRGLQTLRELPRVVLDSGARESEVQAMTLTCEVVINLDLNVQEQIAGWLSLFTLWFRNVRDAEDISSVVGESLKKAYLGGWNPVLGAVLSGRVQGREGAALCGCATLSHACVLELTTKSKTAAARAAWESLLKVGVSQILKLNCTVARYKELLSQWLQLTADQDLIFASGAAFATHVPVLVSSAVYAPIATSSADLPPAFLALMRRLQGGELRRPAAWWKERSSSVHLDSICVGNCIWCAINYVMLTGVSQLPPNDAGEEILAESIHMVKVNKAAELSAQECMSWSTIQSAVKVISTAARDPARHESLLASGVVDALMWTTAHEYPLLGSGIAQYSATVTVALIGRNEVGLTPTRQAVNFVLDQFHIFFDDLSTHWLVKRAAKAANKVVVAKALPILDIGK